MIVVMDMDEMVKSLPFMSSSSDKHARVRNTIITTLAAWALYKQAREWWVERGDRDVYVVSLRDHDEVYELVHEWILRQVPTHELKSVRVHTDRDLYDDDESPIGTSVQQHIRMMYDGTRNQRLDVDGHTVTVAIEETTDRSEKSRHEIAGVATLQFRCESIEGRDAVIALLETLAQRLTDDNRTRSRVFVATKWGGWQRLGGAVRRPLDSIILPGNQKKSLVDDMQRFLSREELYVKLGIPWHRGYLLHGPPGTGKTSTAQGLASELDIDVYYVSISDLSSDADIASMLNQVGSHSMLLLEDVDVAHAARDRDDVEKGITLSGLLNALDGVITPHGLITVMTTNNIDVLDKALLRPGRSDRIERIDYATGEQLERLVWQLLGVEVRLPTVTIEHEVTPAEIVEVIKRHIDDPERAAKLIVRRLRKRVQQEG